jgi:trans-aconitate methyltransferase
MYRNDPDPWGFESSAYEQRKYALTLASLPHSRYASAYEPGCSIGVLTQQLALRCESLVASDILPDVLERARSRLQALPHVELQLRPIPEAWPEGPFDLIVLSEIAYYFDIDDLKLMMRHVMGTTSQGAHIIGVHWRGVTDYPLTGDTVHTLIGATDGLRHLVHHLENEFVLDVWERQV